MPDLLAVSGDSDALRSVAARLEEEGHSPTILPDTEGDLLTALRRAQVSVVRGVTPMLWVRPDSSFLYANPAYCQLLGYTLEELKERSVGDVDRLWTEEYWFSEGYQRIKEAGVLTFETFMIRKDTSQFPVEVTANHVEADGEELFFAFIVDIRERREREQALDQAMAEIAHLKDRLQAENVYLREEIRTVSGFDDIVGTSDPLRRVLHQVEQVADTDATVLILGETGTGKELIARAIHDRSPRSRRPLVKVNCAALPASLIESELFGHEKGAFTGAITKRVGRFTLANGGTIFLDEIGDLPIDLQSKLLRVLQEGEFEPLGGDRTQKVDVRVIAATNRDLKVSMEQETFRPDLYYRLTVFPIRVPPLRERPEDIPLLAWAFVHRNEAKLGKTFRTIPNEVMNRLTSYPWPGNVRELENVIQRNMILSVGPSLSLSNLGEASSASGPQASTAQSLEEVERDHIKVVLNASDWRIKGAGGAAERLGLAPSTLRYRMKKLGIRRN